MDIFSKTSDFNTTVGELFAWHEREGALERLIPPWDPLFVVYRKGGIAPGGSALLKITAGPVPVYWHAEHTELLKNHMFRDVQVKGPFAKWVHTHSFAPVKTPFEKPGNEDNAAVSRMTDQIEYALPAPPFGKLALGGFVSDKLRRTFIHRHETLAWDLSLHRDIAKGEKLKIVISGGSGVLGNVLVAFLTTGGHEVIRLVRREPSENSGPGKEAYWNPYKKEIDQEAVKGADAFIHLSGDHIGEGRWTAEKKKRIIDSRTLTTSFIAEVAANAEPRPRVFITASAIGYYGNRCEENMTEACVAGEDFISNVCTLWEDSACAALAGGVRTATMRIGIALTPKGGALERLLGAFQAGLGGVIGSGNQVMSWIGIDDVVGAIYKTIFDDNLMGPINTVAPNPVTNREMTRALSQTLNRPAPFTIPEWAIKLAFGEMGVETVLSSTSVFPEKLIKAGYRFRHPHIGGALAYLLGRY